MTHAPFSSADSRKRIPFRNDLTEGQMQGDFRNDDTTGMIVLCAKTVIDCLDA